MPVLLLALYRVLRSVVAATRRRLRVMTEARGRHGFPVWEFVYLGSTFVGGAMLLKWIAQAMDPHADAKNSAAKKVKLVQQRLGVPLSGLTTHELIAVENVLTPKSIDVDIQDIGGLDHILDPLITQVHGPMTNPDVYSSGLLQHPKGILLYGPPGTGKTMMAKALAKYCEAFFLSVQPSSIQSKWYGDTNKAIQGIFKLAHRLSECGKPCVIFIDEVDALLGKRKELEHEVSISMKNEFMSLWDGIETGLNSRVIVMGATNRPSELDQAVLRRFTMPIKVPLPDTAAREDIIKRHLQLHCRTAGESAVEPSLIENKPLSSLGDKKPLQWVAEHTEDYSGADLLELAREAARHSIISPESGLEAIRQGQSHRSRAPKKSGPRPLLTLADFQAVLKTYKPTIIKAQEFAASNREANSMDPATAALLASIFANFPNRPAYGANGTNDSPEDKSSSEEVD